MVSSATGCEKSGQISLKRPDGPKPVGDKVVAPYLSLSRGRFDGTDAAHHLGNLDHESLGVMGSVSFARRFQCRYSQGSSLASIPSISDLVISARTGFVLPTLLS
jgi:hypothetical protein